MGGLSRVMPVTALAFLFCIFSVVGVPPFGGFYSKGLVIQGLMESARPIVTILAILSALLTAGYLLRVFVLVFLGTPRDHSIHPHREGTPVMVWVVAALGIFSLLSGLLVHFPEELVREALTQFSGGLPVHHAAEVIR
jgi:NADH:ubiquinone oxidoreductase subunit 5 (subunit L)/multisubunit Na+/H+ antiporter MnhA subunit